jgi:hypothetical protein
MRIEKLARVAIMGLGLGGRGGDARKGFAPPLRRLVLPTNQIRQDITCEGGHLVGDRYHRRGYLLAVTLLHGSQAAEMPPHYILARIARFHKSAR